MLTYNIERSIITNSEYIIAVYEEHGKTLKPGKLQQLCYLLEAIYMVLSNDDELYEEEFNVKWAIPANEKLFIQYKNFGNLDIIPEKKIKINPINRKYIDVLYDLFKDFSYKELVDFVLDEGSPANITYKMYRYETEYNYTIVGKEATKEWFSNLIVVKKVKGEDEEND